MCKKFIGLGVLLVFVSSMLSAQDTTTVQTLSFDSYPTKRGLWNFPSDTNSYRKILLYYTLKCPNTSQGCGEWDYSAPNVLYEHTGKSDSVRVNHGHYLLQNAFVNPITYVNQPYSNYYNDYQYHITYSSTTESEFSLGTGVAISKQPFGSSSKQMHMQMLWTANELTTAGLNAGTIDKLKFDLAQIGSQLDNLTIRLRHSTSTELVGFETSGFTEVYRHDTKFSTVGVQSLHFIAPFVWNGTSNIVVDISFENNNPGQENNNIDNTVLASPTTNNTVVFTNETDGYLLVRENDYVDVGLNAYDFKDQVTISFWANGDENVLPRNSSVFEAKDNAGQRRLNCHFPWNDETIYWDAGYRWGGPSRISAKVNTADILGSWNHWAFTKNATSGEMTIWRNGEIWLSGTGKSDWIDEIRTFRIGHSVTGNYKWAGKLDEFRVWNVVLDSAAISDWMHKSVDNSHPNYSNLVLYYDFNQTTIEDQSVHKFHGIPTSNNMIKPFDLDEQFKHIKSNNNRPNVVFVQGSYISTIDSTLVVDTVRVESQRLATYSVLDRGFNLDLIANVIPEGWSYHFDRNGQAMDSTFHGADVSFVNDTLYYYNEPFEVVNKFELGRYITPYGNGLSLGENGFRWVYDVTDFAHFLVDSVDLEAANGQELIDMKFVLIKGTPPRKVLKMSHVWDITGNSVWGHHKYGDLEDDKVLSNTTIEFGRNTVSARLRMTITGHGHNSTTGDYPHCCEWKNNTHYLKLNGNQVDDWHVWQTHQCALNPVFPQGGTWLGSREGWCPGDVVETKLFELTSYITSEKRLDIDYDITPSPSDNVGMRNGVYDMTMDIVEYGVTHARFDAEIYDVVSPNDWEYYSRKNPICNGVKVILRNSGAARLESALFTYKVSGGVELEYPWKGELKFMESVEIELPVLGGGFWLGDSLQMFEVSVSEPNGMVDEYLENNRMATHFNLPAFYQYNPILFYRTNNHPGDNSLTITDVNDSIVYERQTVEANTTYRDSLHLSPGCYTLVFHDEGNDGLNYWANPPQGSGFFYVRDTNFRQVESFQRDFGREIRHSFVIGSIGDSLVLPDPMPVRRSDIAVIAFPNPTQGLLNLEIFNMYGRITIDVVNSIGQKVYTEETVADDYLRRELNLGHLRSGLYHVKVLYPGGSEVVKVVVL